MSRSRAATRTTAATWFDEAERTTTRLGWREASKRWWIADHAEALLELGRLDDAMRILDRWEADASRLGRDWVLAHVMRCRGLAAAAQGAVDDAASLLQDAVAHHERVHDTFGRARALLALGVVRRRQRQKRAARDAIGAALAGFEELGAATWVAKARAELGRIGGRTREKGLTAAESRVSTLVAEGRTNREVAAALFLSRAYGRDAPFACLRQARRALAHRARADASPDSRASEQSSGVPTISS